MNQEIKFGLIKAGLHGMRIDIYIFGAEEFFKAYSNVMYHKVILTTMCIL